MSIGTVIIETALKNIGAHSLVAPADPSDITQGKDVLNSMLQSWIMRDISLGITPLSVPGDELNEPADATNGIVYNLALYMAPRFDNGKTVVSQELRNLARSEYEYIYGHYLVHCIPSINVSSTLPRGAGNTRGIDPQVFYGTQTEINSG